MNLPKTPSHRRQAFTLVEVVMAFAIAALTVGTALYAYVQSAQRAEWSAYNLAGQSLAHQGTEQARAAKWDPLAFPVMDQLVQANFPPQTNVLDIPISGTNLVLATNFFTIGNVSTTPPLKLIRVDTVWSFRNRNFTNTVVTYRAPDQ
jgi:type II secretory pathway pseudopilin PulG